MPDVLILGATGYTGRLITRYLAAHPDRASFTLALGARSRSKLAQLVAELKLDSSIELIEVEVTNDQSVADAVKRVNVVINTVGPYWRWGTPVVRACARHGVHHVDLTGETPWVQDIIEQFDYLAHKSGAVIIPSCGFDSIPSDLVAHLGVKTLRTQLATAAPPSINSSTPLTESEPHIRRSVTSVKMHGGISGGTLQSVISSLEEVPRERLSAVRKGYAISPVTGPKPPRPSLISKLPHTKPASYGALFPLGPHNVAIVQRTWGLLQRLSSSDAAASATQPPYGPDFEYDEFMGVGSRFQAALTSLTVVFAALCLTYLPPVRWVLKKLAVPAGSGPSDEALERGWMNIVNITSASSGTAHARTVLRGRGDPGYLLTAMMIAECGLALLDPSSLTPLARQGGVLTPMSALGDALIARLRKSDRFQIESEIFEESEESRKTR